MIVISIWRWVLECIRRSPVTFRISPETDGYRARSSRENIVSDVLLVSAHLVGVLLPNEYQNERVQYEK